jgi:hypothetical protein
MKATVTLFLALALAGCASAIGRGVSSHNAILMCGSEEAFAEEVAEVREQFKAGTLRDSPTVGMTGCRVLAMYGTPHKETRVNVGYGVSRHWTYWFGAGPSTSAHLVVLEAGPSGRWVVRSVVW